MVSAINAALMGDKDGKFGDFLDNLQGETEQGDLTEELKKMKDEGYPIEEN